MSLKVPKQKTPVLIYTATHRIEGMHHARPGIRILDDLNGRLKAFLPLTNVCITNVHTDGEVVVECDFAPVNIHAITLFCPNPRVAEAIPSGRAGKKFEL